MMPVIAGWPGPEIGSLATRQLNDRAPRDWPFCQVAARFLSRVREYKLKR
jgi:hypothetical protein